MNYFIKLKNGDQLISNVHVEEQNVILNRPLEIFMDVNPTSGSPGVSLVEWIPSPFVVDTIYPVSKSDVLFMTQASDMLSDYYENMKIRIDNFRETVRNKFMGLQEEDQSEDKSKKSYH